MFCDVRLSLLSAIGMQKQICVRRYYWASIVVAAALFVQLISAAPASAQEITEDEIKTAVVEIGELRNSIVSARELDEKKIFTLTARIVILHDKILDAPAIRAQPPYMQLACDLDLLMWDIGARWGSIKLDRAKRANMLKYPNDCLEHAEEAGSLTAPWESLLRAHIEKAQSDKITNLERLDAEFRALRTMYAILQQELPSEVLNAVVQRAIGYSAQQFQRTRVSAKNPFYSNKSVELIIQERSAFLNELLELIKAMSVNTAMPDTNKHLIYATIWNTLKNVGVAKDPRVQEDDLRLLAELKLLASDVDIIRVMAAIESIETAGAPDWSSQKSQLTDLILNGLRVAREIGNDQQAKFLEGAMAKVRDI